jgi:hypothetical protein
MTCIVIVKNPGNGCVAGIVSEADGDIPDLATWPTADEAEAATKDQPLVKAWGGFVVDLDNLEVREV